QTKDNAPARIDTERLESGRHDSCQIVRRTLADLLLDRAAILEPMRQSVLRWSVHGEEGIGDDLEARECGLQILRWPEGGDPADLHLRKSGDLAEAAEDKR